MAKYLIIVMLVLLVFVVVFGVSMRAEANVLEGKNVLIAYFSWSGNTETFAKMISAETGGTLFKVQTVKPYPTEYRPCTEVAKKEQNDNARPELSTHVQDFDNYDVIFLGYPNWWGTIPMAVFTFLEEYDLSEKIIIPFCTHEGSGLGRGPSDIEKLVSGGKVIEGLAIRGGNINGSENNVKSWITKLGK